MNQATKRRLTRQTLIDKGYEMINTYGYHAVSIDNIINSVGLTKGAFYYHFDNKHHFMEAVILERISKEIHANFIEPINGRGNPIFILSDLLQDKLLKDKSLDQHLGSSLTNFITDLSHEANEYDLQLKLKDILNDWQVAMIGLLHRGIEDGYINRHIHPESVAEFIIISIEGVRTLKKVTNNTGIFYNYIQELKNYLETLKVAQEDQNSQRYYLAS